MTFIYTNLTRIPSRYTGCAKIKFLRQGFRKLSYYRHIQTGRQTDRQTPSTLYITPLLGWPISTARNILLSDARLRLFRRICFWPLGVDGRRAEGLLADCSRQHCASDRKVTSAVGERTSDLLSAWRRCRLAASISKRSAQQQQQQQCSVLEPERRRHRCSVCSVRHRQHLRASRRLRSLS